jgi:hypothetical protein
MAGVDSSVVFFLFVLSLMAGSYDGFLLAFDAKASSRSFSCFCSVFWHPLDLAIVGIFKHVVYLGHLFYIGASLPYVFA